MLACPPPRPTVRVNSFYRADCYGWLSLLWREAWEGESILGNHWQGAHCLDKSRGNSPVCDRSTVPGNTGPPRLLTATEFALRLRE